MRQEREIETYEIVESYCEATIEEIQKSQWKFIIEQIAMFYGQLARESDIEFLSKKCMETYTLMLNYEKKEE